MTTAPDADQLASMLFSRFVGRQDIYAVQQGRGFRPTRRPICAADLRQHIEGRQCFGFYPLRLDHTVLCSALDFDGKHEQDWRERAIGVVRQLQAIRLPCALEVSQSGNGAHVWLFMVDPVPARLIRQFWTDLLRAAGIQCREIYPRQDTVPEGGLGNLIRYPLWGQSRFCKADWQPLDSLAALRAIEPIRPGRLVVQTVNPPVVATVPGLSNEVQQALTIPAVARRWSNDSGGLADQSRSGVLMSLARHLVQRYIPTDDIRDALQVWGRRHGATDKTDRPDWLNRTLQRAYTSARQGYGGEGADRPVTMADCVWRELREAEDNAEQPCPLGVEPWDMAHNGVSFGELALVAARPSHGKSAMVLQWADVQSSRRIPSVLISEEMSARALAKRYILRMGRGQGNADRGAAIDKARTHLANRAPIYVYQSCGTIDRAEEVIQRHVEQDGVRAVVVDYAQLLTAKGRPVGYENVGEVAKRLRRLATKHEIAVVAAAQLNRQIEMRPGTMPRLSDLGDSGQLERVADIVMVMRWPWRDDPDHTPGDELILYTIKHRNAEIKAPVIKTRFHAASQRIG